MALTVFDFDYMQQWAQSSTLGCVASDGGCLGSPCRQQRRQTALPLLTP